MKYLKYTISSVSLLLLRDIFKKELNKNILLTLLKNVFAYLPKAIVEKYSHHLFYLFETTVLNFSKIYNKIPWQTGSV